MKNLNLVKLKEANDYFKRNFKYHALIDDNYADLDFIKSLEPKSILDIGCVDGSKLNYYRKNLKTKINYGVDLSDKAIKYGKKKFKGLKLLNQSSLQINKIKINFDIIICAFFLYLLDREEVFKQFDLIHKKLNNDGYLIINDFDPLFHHTNKSDHHKNLKTFKMKYDNFLEQSGLFKVVYKKNYTSNDRKVYKSNDISVTIFKKINFTRSYPENL